MRYSIFSVNPCPILSIISMGFSKNPKITRFGPGQRNQYIIHYVTSGRGFFNGNPVSAGQGFLITPHMPEHYFPDLNDPWEFFWVISDDPKMKELLPPFHADAHTHIFRYDFVDRIKTAADRIIAHHNAVYDPYDMLELFLSLYKNHTKENSASGKPSNAELYLEAAVHYIRANLFRPVTVLELTQLLGVSQPYLYKIFKAKFQQSPKQYISGQKLSHAQTLLKTTTLSVTQVAASVGFSDPLAFSRYFSGKTGISPASFRKMTQGKF